MGVRELRIMVFWVWSDWKLTYEKLLDAIRALNYPTRSEAKFRLERDNKFNAGTQKALDSFYNQIVLKNGTRILRTSKGQIQVRNKKGLNVHHRGYERFIKQFKEKTKKWILNAQAVISDWKFISFLLMDMACFAKRLIVLNGDLQILASLLMFNWLNCEPTGERVSATLKVA